VTPITTKQKKLLDFVRSYLAEHDLSPDLTEIGEHMGCTRHSAWEMATALVHKGYLSRTKKAPRGLALTDSREHQLELALRALLPIAEWANLECSPPGYYDHQINSAKALLP
jgi:SOS-response transcriptional repressor LexA